MTDKTIYRVTFLDGSTCHYGVESTAKAAARGTGAVDAITIKCAPDLRICTGNAAHNVRADVRVNDIDDRFAGRLALLLECMLIDPNGYWNESASLLDEYKAEWDKVNPPLPTFMGEPMPSDRKSRMMEMKAARAGKEQDKQ